MSWSTGPRNSAGGGGLHGVTPLALYRSWVTISQNYLGTNFDLAFGKMNGDCVRRGDDKSLQTHKAIKGSLHAARAAPRGSRDAFGKGFGSAVLVASAAFLFASSDAHAVMRGQGAGSISKHVVKLVGHNLLCTATVIGRQQLLTANHWSKRAGPSSLSRAVRASRLRATRHPDKPRCSRWRAPSPGSSFHRDRRGGQRRRLHHRGLRHGERSRADAVGRPSRRRGSSPTAATAAL